MKTTVAGYVSDIAVIYLMIPVITVAIGCAFAGKS